MSKVATAEHVQSWSNQDDSKGNEWEELDAHQTQFLRGALCTKDGIWYSTDYDMGRQGMVQYNTKTRKIGETVKYPQNFKAHSYPSVQYQDRLCLIDVMKGSIAVFHPGTKQIAKVSNMQKTGWVPSAIQLHDQIHILNGKQI